MSTLHRTANIFIEIVENYQPSITWLKILWER